MLYPHTLVCVSVRIQPTPCWLEVAWSYFLSCAGRFIFHSKCSFSSVLELISLTSTYLKQMDALNCRTLLGLIGHSVLL